ncbi:hypothetical protein ACFYKX_10705 [Cytobacillus sp. FJAT-54145]|uniref:DUF4926 domain-containing protein n=1 Tax=Cytobacillus spartinae TaxID=3299023 RepID=A0ABW6KBF6_9BACI
MPFYETPEYTLWSMTDLGFVMYVGDKKTKQVYPCTLEWGEVDGSYELHAKEGEEVFLVIEMDGDEMDAFLTQSEAERFVQTSYTLQLEKEEYS